jgi:hypothetical protein
MPIIVMKIVLITFLLTGNLPFPHAVKAPPASVIRSVAVPVKVTKHKARLVARGVATWYRYVPGHAAAGPALRSALGPRWRGKTVKVCDRAGRCVSAVLSDWCACGGGRVIDLDHRLFTRLAPPSRGVIHVTVHLP